MSCVVAFCLMLDAGIYNPVDYDAVRRVHHGAEYDSTFTSEGVMGYAHISVEHETGVYIGYEHESSVEDSHDRGFEKIQIGIRRSFSLPF